MAVEIREQGQVVTEQAGPKPIERGLSKGIALRYAQTLGIVASKESVNQLRANHETGYREIEDEAARNKQVLQDTLLVGFLTMLRRPVRQEILTGVTVIDGKKGSVSTNLNGN